MGQVPKGCGEDRIVLIFGILTNGMLRLRTNVPRLGICGTFNATTIHLCKRCLKKYGDAFPLPGNEHTYPLDALSVASSGKV